MKTLCLTTLSLISLSIAGPIGDRNNNQIKSQLLARQDDAEAKQLETELIAAFSSPLDIQQMPHQEGTQPSHQLDGEWISDGSTKSHSGLEIYSVHVDNPTLIDFLTKAKEFGLHHLHDPPNWTKEEVASCTFTSGQLSMTQHCSKESLQGFEDAANSIWGTMGALAHTMIGDAQAITSPQTRTGQCTDKGHAECDYLILPAFEEHDIGPRPQGNLNGPGGAPATATDPGTGQCVVDRAKPGECENTGGGGKRRVKRVEPQALVGTDYTFTLRSIGPKRIIVGLMLDLARTAWDMIWASANPDATEYAGIRALSHYAFGVPGAINGAMANQLFHLVTYSGQRILFQDMMTIVGHAIQYGMSQRWDKDGGLTTAFGGQILSQTGAVIAIWGWGTTVQVVAQTLGVELPPTGSIDYCEAAQVTNPDGSIQIGCAARYILGG